MLIVGKEGAAMKKKWSNGKIAGVIIGSIFAGVLLCTVLFVSIFITLLKCVVYTHQVYPDRAAGRSFQEEGSPLPDQKTEKEEKTQGEPKPSAAPSPTYPDSDSKDAEGYQSEDGYYELKDAVIEGLSYEVAFRNYDYVHPDNENIIIQFVYPIVSGSNVPNIDSVNDAIQKEMQVVSEYVASIPDYLGADESYQFEGTGYVTYMSESVLSVVYVEYGYMNGEYLESYIVPVNIDMRSGLIMNNEQLLEINDQFSVDFRRRCEEQNGENQYLSMLSDQDITSYLTDKDYMIAFYTPLGMEIGFNFYDGWVTVTYQDYKKFQKLL